MELISKNSKMGLEKVSVGVVAYERPQKLQNLLDSAEGRGFKEIKICDNSEKMNLAEEIDSQEAEINHIGSNLGVGKARNLLFERIESEYLLVMDDDTVVPTNVDDLLTILSNEAIVGISGNYVEGGNLRSSSQQIKLKKNKVIVYPPLEQPVKRTENLFWIKTDTIGVGACLLKKQFFKNLKFDPRMKFGGEHFDYMIRAKKEGYQFGYTPHVAFTHYTKEKDYTDAQGYKLFKDKYGDRVFAGSLINTKAKWYHKLKHKLMRMIYHV